MKRRKFILNGTIGLVGCFASTSVAAAPRKVSANLAPSSATVKSFSGTPNEIGMAYGKEFATAIEKNIRILLNDRIPMKDQAFREWVQLQEKHIEKNWPWYIEEMHGVAEGIAGKYEDILHLNLRAWQYDIYGAPPTQSCSSLAIKLANGYTVCAGALDDPLELYCGPVRFATRNSYSIISFPITGTSWANRGINTAGLTMGISSQILPGLKKMQNAVVQDVAMRAILQTCATVNEVREFCLKFPFTINLVCVDAAGDIFCAQQTAAGLREIKVRDACALTNHIVDEDTKQWLSKFGVTEFPQSPTTVPRRNKLLHFIETANGKCTAEEVMTLIARRDDSDPGSINNSGTIYLTYACPQAEKSTFWILQPKLIENTYEFLPFVV